LIKQAWGSAMTPKARAGLITGFIVGASMVGVLGWCVLVQGQWPMVFFAVPLIAIMVLAGYSSSKSKREDEINERARKTAHQRLYREVEDDIDRKNNHVHLNLVEAIYNTAKARFSVSVYVQSCSPNGHILRAPPAEESVLFSLSVCSSGGADFLLELDGVGSPIELPQAGSGISLDLVGKNRDDIAIPVEKVVVPCVVILKSKEFEVSSRGWLYCEGPVNA